MTSNALRSREVLKDLMINDAKLRHDKQQQEKNRTNDIIKAQIGAVGNVGKGLVSAFKANSPEWYKKWPDLGRVIGKGIIPTYVVNDVVYDYTVFMPSIVTFYYVDTYGPILSETGTQRPVANLAINEAALRYQTNLYSYNSVLSSVAPSDVMQYTLQACDMVVLLCQVARALKAYKTFDVNTNGLNLKLVEACGWNPSDMKLNYKNIMSWLDTEIESFNRDIAIPSGITLLDRKFFLASGCWAEDYGKNSAIYVTRPLQYRLWSESTGRLTAYNYPQLFTFQNVMNIFTNMKNKVIGSSNLVELVRNIKSGVRNGLKLIEVPLFEEGNLPIYPVDEVLEQIMNAVCPPKQTIVPGSNTFKLADSETDFWTSLPNGYHLNQDSDGYLVPTKTITGTTAMEYQVYDNVWDPGVNFYFEPKMLNFLHDDVSVDDFIVATRFTSSYYNDIDESATIVRQCGTEVMIGARLMRFKALDTTSIDIVYPSTAYTQIIEHGYALRAFPSIYILSTDASDHITTDHMVQDWHSMVTLDMASLYQMHRAAVLSEFYIPAVDEQGSTDIPFSKGYSKNKHHTRNKKPGKDDKKSDQPK